MNVLADHKRALILKCLTEGMSLRATARVADAAKATVTRLFLDAGKVCAQFQDREFRRLPCTRIEVDEIWAFVYAKEKNVLRAKCAPPEAGDVWTWVATCVDSKLVPSWLLGDRSLVTATEFMQDLQPRLENRVQLTSDGHNAYLQAVESAFGAGVDYARLVKHYGTPGEFDPDTGEVIRQARYTRSTKEVVEGTPDPALISTSYIERQNLTMRMSMRRFTRRTNAFSKKAENLAHSLALHFWAYNFCRLHQTTRITPAMAAGVTERLWEISDLVRMVDAARPAPNRPTHYKRRASISN